MSEQRSNGDLLKFIATTVETMRDQMATKDDLVKIRDEMDFIREQMATKDDLRNEVGILRDEMEVMRGQMATKDDLRHEVGILRDQMEVMGGQMATKDELARLETKVDLGFTTVRGDFEQVYLRFDTLDRALSSRMGHIETEVSRLRSVVYLLVRDKPDMLRLLGQ